MLKNHEIMTGPEAKPEDVEKITTADLRAEIPKAGETIIVLQRNAKDNRKKDGGLEFGALVPESAEQVRIGAKDFFDTIFDDLTTEERATIDIMVVASDAEFLPPSGDNSKHQRGVETGEQVMVGIGESMKEYGVDDDQLLNNFASPDTKIDSAGGGPIRISDLKDLEIMKNSPDFVKFLVKKYGTDKNFWVAYEVDKEKSSREEMGAEGPQEIADRMSHSLSLFADSARRALENNPDRRMIIWAVSHYDSISPLAKKHILDMSVEDGYLPVDYGGGISIKIDKAGSATTTIQGQEYQVNLE